MAREVRLWRELAATIPDAPIRSDALRAIDRKRGHTDGAALFCTIPAQRSPELLQLLVAYELMWDYLDSVNERAATAGVRNGLQLHRALMDALDPRRPSSDYYRFHPWCNDGGYLRALVRTCRQACLLLPSYQLVRPLLMREAGRADVLALNHDLDSGQRDAHLRAWAARQSPICEVAWFEASGAASASTTIHALLALAASPRCRVADAQRTQRAYYPWISKATTMLDSYVDQLEDAQGGDHSYVRHYPTRTIEVARIQKLIRRSLHEALALPDGERHAVIVACMIAMYLSKDSARARELRASSVKLLAAGGSLSAFLLPILRMWRTVYRQRSC